MAKSKTFKTPNTYPKLSIIKALYLRAFDDEYHFHPSFLHPQYLGERVFLIGIEEHEIALKVNDFQALGLLHDGDDAKPPKKRRGVGAVIGVEDYYTIKERIAEMDLELEKGATEGKEDAQILAMLVEVEEKAKAMEERKKSRLRGGKVEVEEEKEKILLAGETPFGGPVPLNVLLEAFEPPKEKMLKRAKAASREATLKEIADNKVEDIIDLTTPKTSPKKIAPKKTAPKKPATENAIPEKTAQEKETPDKHVSKKRKRNVKFADS